MEPARSIPRPIKREVRQRCGFGCVLCGLPLYEYEHMEGWADVRRHDPKEITLLCSRHHAERTRGLLPIVMVREANARPFNLRSDVTPPFLLHFSGSSPTVVLGSIAFERAMSNTSRAFAPIVVDGEPLVKFRNEDGQLLLSLKAYDRTNKPVLVIDDNELCLHVSGPWDCEFSGKTMTIRGGPQHVFLALEFAVPDTLVVTRGTFLRNGVWIEVDRRGLFVHNTGASIEHLLFSGFDAGIAVGALPADSRAAVCVEPVARFPMAG